MWKLVGLVFVSCETGTGEMSLFSLSHWVFSSSSRAARTAREGETDVGCSLHRASGGGGRLLCGRLWRGIPPQKVFRRKGGLRQPASRPGPFVSMERRVGCSSDRGGGVRRGQPRRPCFTSNKSCRRSPEGGGEARIFFCSGYFVRSASGSASEFGSRGVLDRTSDRAMPRSVKGERENNRLDAFDRGRSPSSRLIERTAAD